MATAPQTDVRVTVGDVDVSPIAVWTQTTFSSVAGAQPGTASIVLREPKTSHESNLFEAVDVGQVVKLHLNDELKWQGFLFTLDSGYAFSAAAVRQKTLSCVDLNILLDKLILYNHADPTKSLTGGGTYQFAKVEGGYIVTVPQHTTDGDYIKAMLKDTDIDLVQPTINTTALVQEIAQINPDGKFTPPTPGMTLRAFMQDVAANVNRGTPGSVIYYIDPTGYLIYREQDREWANFSVGDTGPEADHQMVRDLRMTQDISRIKNDVLMFTGNLNPDPASTQSKLLYRHSINQSSVNQYGRFQYSEILSTAWLQQAINVRASKVLTQEGIPAGRAEFTTFRPGLFPGELVNIHADEHAIVENYPIRALSMTFPEPDLVSYQVTCSFDTQDPWGLLLALKQPVRRGLVQPPFLVIDLTKPNATVQPAETYTLVKEYPRSLSGDRWQCSYAYIRYSMVVFVGGLRQISVPAEGETVGFLEVDPDEGIFQMKPVAGKRPYVEYHVWHDLTYQ